MKRHPYEEGTYEERKPMTQRGPSSMVVFQENLMREMMDKTEIILPTPEPVERPKEVCMEEAVSSSGNQPAKPTLSDPWEPHLGPLSDSWVLEYFGPRMAEAEKVLLNRDSSRVAKHDAVMKLCKYSAKISTAKRRAR
jgi:hypothetical protein